MMLSLLQRLLLSLLFNCLLRLIWMLLNVPAVKPFAKSSVRLSLSLFTAPDTKSAAKSYAFCSTCFAVPAAYPSSKHHAVVSVKPAAS